MATRMLQRRGTAAEWAAANPVLGDGEVGFETDTKVLKLGDGVTAWNALTSPFEPYLLKTGKAADSNLLDGLDSTAFMLATATKSVLLTHTFTITGEVKVASGDTSFIPGFFVPIPTGKSARFLGGRSKLNSGTSVTFDIRRNGSNISAVNGATTTATTFSNNVVLADQDLLSLVVTAVSGTPKNLSLSVYVEYTF